MLSETVTLEKLRQKIDDLQAESGDRANYLDYGKPNAEQVRQTNETIKKLNEEIKATQEELERSMETARVHKPQAIEEWVNYHIALLQTIIAENPTGPNAGTRKYVARETLQNWEKVGTGELKYVNINGHFLKDYKDHLRSFNENSKIGDLIQKTSNQTKPKDKVWWQFWK